MSIPDPKSPAPETPPPVPGPPPASTEQNTWAMLCHLSTFAGFIGVPFGNILGPLVVWLIKKDEMPLVDDQGKEALNFQISMTIYLIPALISIFVLIGLLIVPALIVFDIIVTIIAALKANEGIAYRYPLCIRFLT